MTEKQERKHGIVINAGFLVSLLVLVITAYAAYVVTTFEKKLEQQYQTSCKQADEIREIRDIVITHIAHEEGRKSRERNK